MEGAVLSPRSGLPHIRKARRHIGPFGPVFPPDRKQGGHRADRSLSTVAMYVKGVHGGYIHISIFFMRLKSWAGGTARISAVATGSLLVISST